MKIVEKLLICIGVNYKQISRLHAYDIKNLKKT